MLKVYSIKNCDSVRKAIKHFNTHDLAYEFIDFRETPVDEATITSWLKYTDIKTLFNTRGTTYRTLKLKELDLNDVDKQRWLFKKNMLIKRPVVQLDNKVIVGYNESQYLELL